MKLGYSIGKDVFGYGLVLPHYGTIVVGNSNTIGNYAVIHTSTCITNRRKTIGDGLYLSTGAKIITGEDVGNGITISANSVVTKGVTQGYALFVGMPATKKCNRKIWYEQEGGIYAKRVEQIEQLKSNVYVV